MSDPADTPSTPPATVPVRDLRHQVEMTWTVRGPWAELLGPGAEITITHKDLPHADRQ